MRTGEYCISNIDKLVVEGCITHERAADLKKWQAFRIAHPEISGLTEGACKPLMREKNLEVQVKALETIAKQLRPDRRSTAGQVTKQLQNIHAGKSNRGGDHKGASIVEDKPEEKLSDYVDPIETVEEKKDPEETDPVEVIGDEVYSGIYDEAGDTGDIPDMPDDIEPTPEVMPEAIIDPKEIEEDIDPEENIEPEPEITSKIVKENLVNAGHEDPEPKRERIPTEDEKQAIFEKCVAQASKWGIRGDEIARRMRIAITFVSRNEKGGN